MPFKPRRTVSGPRGTFELYVSKYVGVFDDQRRRERELERRREGFVRADEGAALAARRRPSFLRDLLGRWRSSAVRIEAICWGPPDEKLLWTTTDDSVERVLDEIVEGFKQGKIVQPLGAVYSGQVDVHSSPGGLIPP